MARESVEKRATAFRQSGSLARGGVWLLAAIAVLAGLIFGGLTWAPNLMRHQIGAKVGELVGREVSIGRIEVSPLLGRIIMTDIVVMRPPAPKPTLVAKRLMVDVSPLAYLHGRVVVRNVQLEDVKARIVRHAPFGFDISDIIERIQRSGMQSKFGRILVPTEEVVEMKNGQKKTTERRFFPGYVLVEMVMDDESWHLVKHTNKVTGFVGGAKNRPAPISQDEVQKIVSQMQEGSDKPRHKVEFMVGELVRVKEGPFTDFNGSIEEVNYEKNKVRVSVTIFGRATPVELEFGQIEKT
jgi:transcriptional antiterminator NusG